MKDYRKGGQKTVMTLQTREFIRRFCLHILPKRFTIIRHYGILSSGWKKEKLPKLQEEMGVKKEENTEEGKTAILRRCPTCRVGELETIFEFNSREPPKEYESLIKHILQYFFFAKL